VRAAVAVTGVLVFGVLSAFSARAPFNAAAPAPLRAGVLDPVAVTLGVGPAGVHVETGSTSASGGRAVRYRYADAVLRTSGVPPAVVLQPWSVESAWHPGDAPPIQWQRQRAAAYRRSVQRDTDDDGQPLASIAQALGNVELLRPVRAEASAFHTTLLSLPEAQVSRLSSAQGRLDATVTLRAWRYRIVDAVPLVAGSTVSARLGRLTVRSIAATRNGAQVDVQGAVLQRMWLRSEDLFGSGGFNSAEFLALRNTARKQAVLVAREYTRHFSYSFMGLSDARVGTEARRLEFIAPFADGEFATLDEVWLHGAELIVLRPEDLGAFSKPLRIENVNMGIKK
jgi:hypothetical protein